eukprot:CAMPEP_0115171012 /NCGR_PEP_ID=MMETSP0270-20121206/2087_1 /TAXON_ID=71861 /ORGANISM="Scrippsiella trochoidea, Strain CCMP3099" /LENGTH=126 /DNA_ID=CAMNT_0002583773 /DNA_START=1304 /DNA_END=1684 /DNA_ORIENTATION=+
MTSTACKLSQRVPRLAHLRGLQPNVTGRKNCKLKGPAQAVPPLCGRKCHSVVTYQVRVACAACRVPEEMRMPRSSWGDNWNLEDSWMNKAPKPCDAGLMTDPGKPRLEAQAQLDTVLECKYHAVAM